VEVILKQIVCYTQGVIQMKKTNLIGMFALTFALVFGAVACSSGSSASSAPSAAEALKDKDAKYAGKWKCTEDSSTSTTECSDKDAYKKITGVDWKDEEEKEEKSEVGTVMELTEEEARATFAIYAAMEEANETNKEETVAARKKAMEESCKAIGATLDAFEMDSSMSATLDESTFTFEASGSSSYTVTKGDDSFTVTSEGSSVQVWEKQE